MRRSRVAHSFAVRHPGSLTTSSKFTTTSMVKKIAPVFIGDPMFFAYTEHRLKGEEESYEPYI